VAHILSRNYWTGTLFQTGLIFYPKFVFFVFFVFFGDQFWSFFSPVEKFHFQLLNSGGLVGWMNRQWGNEEFIGIKNIMGLYSNGKKKQKKQKLKKKKSKGEESGDEGDKQ